MRGWCRSSSSSSSYGSCIWWSRRTCYSGTRDARLLARARIWLAHTTTATCTPLQRQRRRSIGTQSMSSWLGGGTGCWWLTASCQLGTGRPWPWRSIHHSLQVTQQCTASSSAVSPRVTIFQRPTQLYKHIKHEQQQSAYKLNNHAYTNRTRSCEEPCFHTVLLSFPMMQKMYSYQCTKQNKLHNLRC